MKIKLLKSLPAIFSAMILLQFCKKSEEVVMPILGAVSSASASQSVYVSGASLDNAGVNAGVYWKDGIMQILPSVSSTNSTVAKSISADDYGNVYGAGESSNASGVLIPGYWRNGVWQSLPVLSATKSSSVSKVAVDLSGNVYAGGYSIDGTSVQNGGYWKNGTWTAVAVVSQPSSVNDVFLDKAGNVYLAGFNTDTNVNIASYWKNGNRTDLAALNAGKACRAVSINADASGNIYTGGVCLDAAGMVWVPGYWKNGASFVNLPVPDASKTTDVNGGTLDPAGNHYVTGILYGNAARTSGYWKNGKWNTLSQLVSGKECLAQQIYATSSSIYVSGLCLDGNNIAIPGYWKNGAWNSLGQLNVEQGAAAIGIYVR